MKNLQAKRRELDDPYEIWVAGDWEWRVLKKYHADDDKEFARWLVACKSPYTGDRWEYGDTYVSEVKQNATRIK